MASDCLGLEITELRLGLPGGGFRPRQEMIKNEKKRVFSEIDEKYDDDEKKGEKKKINEVVGWPPVCSYRRKNSFDESKKKYVKISMDGAPYLRKIDLSVHKSYFDLLVALEKLFGCYGIGEAMNDGESSEYVPIYEDKDGDWMLVGDVPWNMFIESCKRLRIMKKTEAKGIGLHPKAAFSNKPSNSRDN